MLYSVGTISNFASASMMTCLTSRISRGLFSSTACFKTCYIAQELSLTWDKMLASVIFSGTCLRKLNMLMWSSHFKSSSSLLLKTARAKRNITWQKRTTQSANTEISHSDNASWISITEGIAHHLWLGEGGKGDGLKDFSDVTIKITWFLPPLPRLWSILRSPLTGSQFPIVLSLYSVRNDWPTHPPPPLSPLKIMCSAQNPPPLASTLTLNSHEWPRQNFSSQYPYNTQVMRIKRNII